MNKKLHLIRTAEADNAVYGILIVTDDGLPAWTCVTIENKSKTFPDGTYPIKYEWSPRFQTNLWELYGIDGRSEIKIHVANYYDQLDGCIGVGSSYSDINGDSVMDVASSKNTLAKLHTHLSDLKETTIQVTTIK